MSFLTQRVCFRAKFNRFTFCFNVRDKRWFTRYLPPAKNAVAKIPDLGEVVRMSTELHHIRGNSALFQTFRVFYSPDSPTDETAQKETESSTEILPQTPSDSWIAMELPFSTNSALRDAYVMLDTKYVRVGKILEDLDAFAGDIGHRHTRRIGNSESKAPTPTLSIVTAFLDRIRLRHGIRVDRNLRLCGRVTWVGKSSMEIIIEIWEVAEGIEDISIGQANFMMIARDVKKNKSIEVPSLRLETKVDKLAFEAGKINKRNRINTTEHSLRIEPPSPLESDFLHSQFVQVRDHLDTQSCVPIGDTVTQSSIIMHSQERNMHGQVFGGYLLRLALEQSWTAAYMHAKIAPRMVVMDDIDFFSPVDVGSVVCFKSKVVWVDVKRRLVYTQLSAVVVDPAHTRSLKNKVHFVFRIPDGVTLKQVSPMTYKHGLWLLEARRRAERFLRECQNEM
eukprot:774517_1